MTLLCQTSMSVCLVCVCVLLTGQMYSMGVAGSAPTNVSQYICSFLLSFSLFLLTFVVRAKKSQSVVPDQQD